MKRLTDEELTAIRERCEKATSGPWELEGSAVISEHAESYCWNGASNDVCLLNDGGEYISNTNSESDADFIAHARDDVPRLFAEVERLRKALGNIEALSFYRGLFDDSPLLERAIRFAAEEVPDDYEEEDV